MNIINAVDQALDKLIIISINHKGSHGLHQDSFKLQTMTALIKSFCGGVCAKRNAQGAKRIIRLALCTTRHAPCAFPLAAGGKKI
jgi:hypothetical protein